MKALDHPTLLVQKSEVMTHYEVFIAWALPDVTEDWWPALLVGQFDAAHIQHSVYTSAGPPSTLAACPQWTRILRACLDCTSIALSEPLQRLHTYVQVL
jgi:hypothetical protein